MMKKYLIISAIISYGFLFYACGQKAHAAIAFVSSSTAGGTTAATSATTTIDTTAGNLLVVDCRHGTTFVDPTNATDTISDTFTKFANASNSTYGAITGYYAIATSSSASNIVGCNFASSVSNRNIIVGQYSGVASVSPLDTTSTATSTASTTFKSGVFTTTGSDVIVGFADAGGDGTVTSTSPYTDRVTRAAAFGTNETDLITSTIQTSQQITWRGASSVWMGIVGAFKSATVANTPAGNYRWMGIFKWLGSFIFI